MGNTEAVDYDRLTRTIRQFAWYGDLFLNFSNHLLAFNLKARNKTNFIINLKNGYADIERAYSQDLKQTLHKTPPHALFYTKENNFLPALTSYQKAYAERMPHISGDDFDRFRVVCKLLFNKNLCLVRSVRNEQGIVLSDTVLLKDNKRIYNLCNTTTAEGRLLHSNHWLTDQLLREFSGLDLLFDFEGSDLEGVKTFYKKFGGHIQPYFHYKRNILKGE